MACNGVCGDGNQGFINAPKLDKTFALSQVELHVVDSDVYRLLRDFEVLIGLAKVNSCI